MKCGNNNPALINNAPNTACFGFLNNRTGGLKIAYKGKYDSIPTPAGRMYRMVPVRVPHEIFRPDLFPAGEFIVFPDNVAYAGADARIGDFEKEIRPRLPADPDVLFIRDNGAGDVIICTAALKEFRRRVPGARITFATLPRHFDLIGNTGLADRVASVHDLESPTGAYSLIVNWARAVEDYSVPGNRLHRSDAFSLLAGLGILNDKAPVFRLSDDDRAFAERMLGGRGGGFIGCVMRAAVWDRTWPVWRVPELCGLLDTRLPDHSVVLVDAQEEAGFDAPGVINMCGKTGTFSRAAALLERCDLVITPDTGLAHACGALGIPALVLTGAIPPAARFSHYGNFHWIYPEGRVGCVPCWSWQERYAGGPEKGRLKSCRESLRNLCMESIEPEEIAEAAGRIIDSRRKRQAREVKKHVLRN